MNLRDVLAFMLGAFVWLMLSVAIFKPSADVLRQLGARHGIR